MANDINDSEDIFVPKRPHTISINPYDASKKPSINLNRVVKRLAEEIRNLNDNSKATREWIRVMEGSIASLIRRVEELDGRVSSNERWRSGDENDY